MPKLSIDYTAETDHTWPFLRFRQEGFRGFVLPLSYLSEFISALENQAKLNDIAFYMNYFVHNTASSCKLSVSTSEVPLLHLDGDQRNKLVTHLKTAYADML
ncbi:hypothetical protein HC928_00035 [bacterium]|nr:hypothetical protein [bacterium]